MPHRTAVSHLLKRSSTLTGDKVGIDMGLASVILKHIRYKAITGCIYVSERARIRTKSGKRVYAKQFYWQEVLGIRAYKLDAHMERTCAEVTGFKCMNPDHILLKHTNQVLSCLLSSFAQSVEDKAMKSDGKKPHDGGGSVTEDTLWCNHSGATEELVIWEDELPLSMEDETETPQIVDYFSLLPTQALSSISQLRKVNIAS